VPELMVMMMLLDEVFGAYAEGHARPQGNEEHQERKPQHEREAKDPDCHHIYHLLNYIILLFFRSIKGILKKISIGGRSAVFGYFRAAA
jgi:hypothetical protein